MPFQIYTIGHSTHPLDHFLALLDRHAIEVLADIRRFPGSRKFPHFHQATLSESLTATEIKYRWYECLGGRRSRKSNGPSQNLGLRNESFRNYADYMLTDEFHEAIKQLLADTSGQRTALMCSESVFWRCHRRLVSDFLLMKGIAVQHIMPTGELRPHTLTESAKITSGDLIYPAPEADQTQFQFD